LDKIFREIAWKAVVEHPLSGVTDKNKNGIGDHLESAKVIEAAIRARIKKPTGELTKADLEKVTVLKLGYNKLTDVKGLEKLTQLKELILSGNQLTSVKGLEKLTKLRLLSLSNNPDLTKAQIDQLQKALPNCFIHSNPTK
jgi:hypothetical protein